MLFVYDKNSLQGKVIWKIKDEDILNKKKAITYFSPGSFSFVDQNNNVIYFDWSDSNTEITEDGKIISELYSFDYDYITESLKENKYKDKINDEYRLNLFDSFKKLDEINYVADIDEKGKEIDIECIYFELFDPKSGKVLMLIGECEVELKPEEVYEIKR